MKLFVLISLVFTSFTFAQNSNKIFYKNMEINPEIVIDVEKNISENKDIKSLSNGMLIFDNTINVSLFSNDVLLVQNNSLNDKLIFKSYHFWKDKILYLIGTYGLFEGSGFLLKIDEEKAELFHLLISDEIPSFSYLPESKLETYLEVPCTNTQIILSELPIQNQNQVIYGYVEFNSNEYYSSKGSENGEEILPRNKHRLNMKVYFKSNLINNQ